MTNETYKDMQIRSLTEQIERTQELLREATEEVMSLRQEIFEDRPRYKMDANGHLTRWEG